MAEKHVKEFYQRYMTGPAIFPSSTTLAFGLVKLQYLFTYLPSLFYQCQQVNFILKINTYKNTII